MDSVIATIHQCIQRGERPLSVIDLIEKDLLTMNQAAWLVSRVEEGSSWLVGAMPSHAGKTTLMSALLVFLPAQEQATLVRPGLPWESFGPNCCVVAEEISDHGRERYLWNDDVRGFTSIPVHGGRIASTIHATTLEQVREQISRQCAAGENGVASFGMFVPIEVEFAPESPEHNHAPHRGKGGRRHRSINSRTVEFIHFHDGRGWNAIDREVKLTSRQESVAGFLGSCLDSEIRTCKALRQAWLAKGTSQ
jgi:hypothetical protein